MLRKNKEKRKKKGLPEEDFVQGEDPSAPAAAQAPEEATLDDEFSLPVRKGKGGKAGNAKEDSAAQEDGGAEPGRILTKAEKEKQKKEREKQRKKEQVCA